MNKFWQILLLGSSLFVAQTNYCFAQSNDKIFESDFPISPEFPGGYKALIEYLQKNLEYPLEAQKAGIKGKVVVSFVVEPDGTLTNENVSKSLGYGCDEEALRIIKTMPTWKPGSYSGKLIRISYILPLLFGIDYPILTKTHSIKLISN
jgi:periplasmic protein TonB